MTKNNSNRGYKPPDGGYGWIIVLSCVVINASVLPLTQFFGLIYDRKFLEWNITSAQTSFLLHLSSAIMCSLGLFTGPLLKRFNFRQLSLTGATLMCLGIFLTTFSETYLTLIFTVSILIGVGQGILMPATYLAVNSYFQEKLTVAISLQVTGACLIQILMPLFITLLMELYDVKGTILILASISFHALPAIILFRPIKKGNKRNDSDKCTSKAEEQMDSLLEKPQVYQETTTQIKRPNILKDIFKIFDFHLLLDHGYLILIIGMGLSFASELNIIFMMPFILFEYVKFTQTQVAIAMIVQAVGDIFGRLLIPLIAHKIGWSSKILYACSLIGSSIGRTILALFSDTITLVFAASFIIGLFKGSKAVFQSLVIPKYVNFKDLPAATGLSMLTNGVLSLTVGPVIGYTHDVSGSYALTLHVASILSMLCVVFWYVDYVMKPKPPSVDEVDL